MLKIYKTTLKYEKLSVSKSFNLVELQVSSASYTPFSDPVATPRPTFGKFRYIWKKKID